MHTNEASAYLVALARHIAGAYIEHTEPKAIILTGSAAQGVSDFYSDLDMIIYYDTLPSDEQLTAARDQNRGQDFRPLGPRTQSAFAESYLVRGVECQVAHTTIAGWETEMASVLRDLDVASPVQKALDGLLHCIPLEGEALVTRWQAELAEYPDALARAMVEHYLHFFPIWYIAQRMAVRDATLWINQLLVESAFNILGVLAGLNHLYFSPFQFKRTREFAARMSIAPDNLAVRLDSLFFMSQLEAVKELEALVAETTSLVEARMPEIDTAAVRRRLGKVEQPWQPVPIPG